MDNQSTMDISDLHTVSQTDLAHIPDYLIHVNTRSILRYLHDYPMAHL
jgi:hypothetical protein